MEMHEIFLAQQKMALLLRTESIKYRLLKIRKIKKWVLQHENEIVAAIQADLRKAEAEILVSEILPVIAEAKHILRNLRGWTQARTTRVPILFLGTQNRRILQAKGTALIISPWNYPFCLAIKPLLSAISAGCTVILKPSEVSAKTADLLAKMIETLFEASEVAACLGGAETAIALQQFPFDHIHFTGSTRVGKMVMKAAAENLSSVTLELGGKSPTVIDQTADIRKAALKIAYGKFLNAGQTCIAPDYVYVHESRVADFVSELSQAWKKYFDGQVSDNQYYCSIINGDHFKRLTELAADAEAKGGEVIKTGDDEWERMKFAPRLVKNATEEMRIMQEEIFGPILPMLIFNDLSEVCQYINRQKKPLALYMFSKSHKNIAFVERHTSSGSLVVNDFGIQFLYSGVPFGGINHSGIGYSGGYEGFTEFSHIKPVIKNFASPTGLFYPPYRKLVAKLTRFAIRWLS